MAVGNFFLGTPSRIEQIQKYNPQQQKSLNDILSMGMQNLQNPAAGFDPIAQRARSQFSQQTVPGLAERFTSMGGGALSSPAFASQLGSAGSGLEEALAALQAQYGQQQQQFGLQQSQLGLSPLFENLPVSGQPGALESFLPSLMKLLPFAALAIPGVGPAIGGASGLASLLGNLYGGK